MTDPAMRPTMRPTTDTARKIMLETTVHGIVSVCVVASATLLAALDKIDATAWGSAIAAGIAASGAVTVLQGKTGNGHITEESQSQRPGGKRRTDPTLEHE